MAGLDSQIGMAIESVVGTAVTPTTFFPFVSESLKQEKGRLESDGIIAGRRVLTGNMWNGGNVTIGGDVNLELYQRGLGKLFKLMFGGAATTGAGPYTHTFTPASLLGLSGTFQVGRGAVGTVVPYTYTGCKVASWEIACKTGEIATLGLTLVAMNEIGYRTVADGVTTNASAAFSSATLGLLADDDIGKPISGTGIPVGTTIAGITSATAGTLSANATATGTGVTFTVGVPLATASYLDTQKPLKFNYGSATLGGATLPIRSISIAGDNGLDDNRRFLGSRYVREPIEAGLRKYDGKMELEFTDTVAYTQYLAGTMASLVLNFLIPGTTDSATITANVRLDGETPNVGDRGLLSQSVNFKAISTVGGADASAITAVVINGDSTL